MFKTILLIVLMLCAGCVAVYRTPIKEVSKNEKLKGLQVQVGNVTAMEHTGSSTSLSSNFGVQNSYSSSPIYYNGTNLSTSISTINHMSRQQYGEFFNKVKDELEDHGVNTRSNEPELFITANIGEPYIVSSYFIKDVLVGILTLGSYASHHRGVDVTFRIYNREGELLKIIEVPFINGYTCVGLTIFTTMFDPEHQPLKASQIAKFKATINASQELIKYLQNYNKSDKVK